MDSKHRRIALSVIGGLTVAALFGLGMTAVVQDQETHRLQSCVEAGKSYAMAPNAQGRVCE